MAHNVGGAVPSNILAGTTPVTKVMVGTVQVWPDAPPPEVPGYLYDVEQVNKPGRVVDFTALKGFMPADPLDEAFMFRCSTISGLDGYVGRNFTKTFPSGTAYTKFACTLADQYGDGIPANNAEMLKTISFTVEPRATVADEPATRDAMPVGAIKGNADSGLYHMPNSAHYDETIAEQWFTTEAEAKAAGFIKYTGRRKKKS
jgi:hypothetical protein